MGTGRRFQVSGFRFWEVKINYLEDLEGGTAHRFFELIGA